MLPATRPAPVDGLTAAPSAAPDTLPLGVGVGLALDDGDVGVGVGDALCEGTVELGAGAPVIVCRGDLDGQADGLGPAAEGAGLFDCFGPGEVWGCPPLLPLPPFC